MAVDPFHVHVYWEVTPEDRMRAQQRLDPVGRHEAPIWVLRFHDVSLVEFDGTNAHGYFDVPVDLASKNWYVELWSSDKTYFAELGPRSDAGFVAACRSNFEQVPRAEPSPRYEPKWQSDSTKPTPAPGRAVLAPPAKQAAAGPRPGPEPPRTAADPEAAREPTTPEHATSVQRVPGRPPMPPLARPERSASVSLGGGSGSGSAGGPAR